MAAYDEPLLEDDGATPALPPESDTDIQKRIGQLVSEEFFGVLCTQGQEQPYGSMIALAFTDDLAAAIFATSRFTRKYHLLTACNKVAIVVNNREKYPGQLHKIEAITATGRAEELTDDSTDIELVNNLIERHPYLKGFITSPSTSVFRVSIVRYFYVHRFQEVREWSPENDSDHRQA